MQQLKWGFGFLLVLAIVLSFSSPIFAIPEEGAAETAYAHGNLFSVQVLPDTITVFGFGTSRGTPDRALVSFGLTALAPSAREAQGAHRELLDRVAGALAEEGVSRDQVSTLYFNIWPDYGYGSGGGEAGVVGYRVNSTISVPVENPYRVSGVIDAALAAGANRVEGIRYLSSRQDRLKQEALLAAVRDARAQAELIAAALGRKVGRVLAVDQSLAPPYELREDVFSAVELGPDPEALEVTQYVRMVFRLE